MIIIIGGGPAGYFAAIAARETDPSRPVTLLEKNASTLAKVKISGGGRCNVTHACFDPRELVRHYPRGQKELLGPFHRRGPAETMDWFAERGVELKTEPDGRVFPVTDSSATIIDCLEGAARTAGVNIRTRCAVENVQPGVVGSGFTVRLVSGEELSCDKVMLATGGKSSCSGSVGRPPRADGHILAEGLGHSLVPPVPSLFTFRIGGPLLEGLAGVSVPEVEIRLVSGEKEDRSLRQSGPLLVTHRGLSGPAVLKLSAWGARRLFELSYRFEISVNWLPGRSSGDLDSELQDRTRTQGKQRIATAGPDPLPRRLWTALAGRAQIAENTKWADLDRRTRGRLVDALKDTRLTVTGQDTFKEEFVTCGGIPLGEVDFRTMASRVRPGLFLAGELLDIDGVTGGFNFQSCWTTGYLAGLGLVGAAP